MIHENDVVMLVQYCGKHLDLSSIESGNEYGYGSVPLCVIDAVFSINARYASTRNTVAKFCAFFDVVQGSESKNFTPDDQFSVSEFIKMYAEYGVEGMTAQVYRNRQRTSSRNGILKSEAVLRFSEVLARFDVEHLQDVDKVLGEIDFEVEIKTIPGQKSGISLRYFYMLAGSEDFIKPDRMVARFVEQATGKSFDVEEMTALLIKTCTILAETYSGLTPRTLDNVIWQYQREQ